MTGSGGGSAFVEPAKVFTALADIVYQGTDVHEVYAAICVAATLVVPGCDRASLMLRRDGGYTTAAASDEVARAVDKIEIAVGDGPCVDAIEEEIVQIDTDLSAHSQWPALAERLVAETPIRGAMGFRMLVDRRKVGALNLFSDAPNVFDKAAAEKAIVLTAFATVAVNAAFHGEEATTLQRGLASNREIGKAVGMLMVLNDISETEAFDMLRNTSQATNVKLADVAAAVVEQRSQALPG